jgi:hypothetical protein
LCHAFKHDGAEADAINGVDDGRVASRRIANVADEAGLPAAFGRRLRELSPCNRERTVARLAPDTISGGVLFSTLPSLDPDVAAH